MREDGHEAAALGREARQHAAEVEAQRVILGRVHQPDAPHDHLKKFCKNIRKIIETGKVQKACSFGNRAIRKSTYNREVYLSIIGRAATFRPAMTPMTLINEFNLNTLQRVALITNKSISLQPSKVDFEDEPTCPQIHAIPFRFQYFVSLWACPSPPHRGNSASASFLTSALRLAIPSFLLPRFLPPSFFLPLTNAPSSQP